MDSYLGGVIWKVTFWKAVSLGDSVISENVSPGALPPIELLIKTQSRDLEKLGMDPIEFLGFPPFLTPFFFFQKARLQGVLK